jgi:hypothetical protein
MCLCRMQAAELIRAENAAFIVFSSKFAQCTRIVIEACCLLTNSSVFRCRFFCNSHVCSSSLKVNQFNYYLLYDDGNN